MIQRVKSASVRVDGELVSEIGRGLLVLVGIHKYDTNEERNNLVRKILNLRAFEDPSSEEEKKRWNKSVLDLDLEVLLVSQFTLIHSMKGNKPDFRHAMAGEKAKEFFDSFVQEMKKNHKNGDLVKEGKFGAMMDVQLINDGPVTLQLEFAPKQPKELSQ